MLLLPGIDSFTLYAHKLRKNVIPRSPPAIHRIVPPIPIVLSNLESSRVDSEGFLLGSKLSASVTLVFHSSSRHSTFFWRIFSVCLTLFDGSSRKIVKSRFKLSNASFLDYLTSSAHCFWTLVSSLFGNVWLGMSKNQTSVVDIVRSNDTRRNATIVSIVR